LFQAVFKASPRSAMDLAGQVRFEAILHVERVFNPDAKHGKSKTTVRTISQSDASETSSSDEDSAESNADEQVAQMLPAVSNVSQMTMSRTRSDWLYPDPSQTMLFLDWDDTLFPTTDFFDRWGVENGKPLCLEMLDKERQMYVQEWRQPLKEYMLQACSLSECVVIVTNSRRPWVSDCIERFVPELAEVFDGPMAPRVVYARECVKTRRSSMEKTPPSQEEHIEEMTKAKYAAMKQEAERFYSQHPGQSWKNILSCGDMSYEHFAVQELSFKRVPVGKERLRTKSQVLPATPTVSELALRLQFCKLMLPAYIFYDGDFEMDLQRGVDPLESIAEALDMPELAFLSFSRHAWGSAPRPATQEEVHESLADLAILVHESFFD